LPHYRFNIFSWQTILPQAGSSRSGNVLHTLQVSGGRLPEEVMQGILRAPAARVLGTAGAGINEKPHYSCP
jgi:hypothetical protein